MTFVFTFDLASATIISQYVITELSVIFAKYLRFLHIHVARFQV